MNTDGRSNFINEFIKSELKKVFGQEIDWILVDYLDSGKGQHFGQCQCGRLLRRQYTVRHVKTGEEKKFGIVHLKKHLNISDLAANKIQKGIKATFKEILEIEHPPINNNIEQEINEFVHFADEKELVNLNRWLFQLQLGFNLSRQQQNDLLDVLKILKQRESEEKQKTLMEEQKKCQEEIRKKRTDIYNSPIDSKLPVQIKEYIIDSVIRIGKVSILGLWNEILTRFKDTINDTAMISYLNFLEALVNENPNIIFGYEGPLKRKLIYNSMDKVL